MYNMANEIDIYFPKSFSCYFISTCIYIYSVSNQMCYIKMNVAQATTLASKASDVVGWNSSEGAIFHTTNQIFIHLYSSCLTS